MAEKNSKGLTPKTGTPAVKESAKPKPKATVAVTDTPKDETPKTGTPAVSVISTVAQKATGMLTHLGRGHGEVRGTGCAGCGKGMLASLTVFLCLGAVLALGSGCLSGFATTGESKIAFLALGEKAAVAASGINLTSEKAHTNGVVLTNGVGIENVKGTSEADINGMIGKLLVAGIKATPAAPLAPAVDAAINCEDGACEVPEVK